MAKEQIADLTFESLGEEGDIVLPPQATTALAAAIAKRTDIAQTQVTRVLSELSAIAREQVGKHPNRFFVIPGIGAMIASSQGPRTVKNVFTNQVTQRPTTIAVKFKYASETTDAIVKQLTTEH